jgi:archaemetzincin
MLHCVWYLCNMAGSNNLAEIDRHPLAFCPQCFAKICRVSDANPADQLEKLRDYCRQNGLADEARLYGEMASKMRGE